jgi:hypothetical protein
MRSRDAGLHWSAPARLAPIRTAQLFVPDDNFPIRAEDYLPDIAIDPTNGDMYVVWSDGLGTPINRVVMSKSTDGGRHWSGPVLTYYDDRNNVLDNDIATTDVWLRHSHDGARDLGAGAAPPRSVRPLRRARLVLRAGRPAGPVPR